MSRLGFKSTHFFRVWTAMIYSQTGNVCHARFLDDNNEGWNGLTELTRGRKIRNTGQLCVQKPYEHF